MNFTREDYDTMHRVVFCDGYPGYKPSVKEIPNGDQKIDVDKRWAHVAVKYLKDARLSDADFHVLNAYLWLAHILAENVARALGVPKTFMPSVDHCALRVLEYPPGAISNEHTDPNLFTLMLYRDQPDRFVSDWNDMPSAVRSLNEHSHLGEMGEMLGLGRATRHSVLPSNTMQRSIVYFAVPHHDAVFPSGQTVKLWLDERLYTRGRVSY